ncbi:MAG TPA: glycoside hydrolase family 2 TIM barrel-domain containing protein [Bacteroidales bacterium]|nr:glycoside hydrolase family 2 TIM barrel-domain containing protein [Bacteroidales bacterium]
MKYFVIIVMAALLASCSEGAMLLTSSSKALSGTWKMQPDSLLMGTDGKLISQNEFDQGNWLDAVVPGTVLGSLVADGKIEDPYFGTNMQKVSPVMFRQPWWFRTTFNLTSSDIGKVVSLRFNGINYRADLWVNGKLVAGKETFAGTFKMFTFNITSFVREGSNTIALKLLQHADGEYSIGFVDWNPLPRDRSMGIFREVFLEINDGVKIRSPFVYSKVRTGESNEADLNIQAQVINSLDRQVSGTLKVDFGLGHVEKKVSLKAGETVSCEFSPKEFKELSVSQVKLWWPNGTGSPDMYPIKVEFVSGGKILDRVEKKYGIREVKSYLDKKGNRVFEVNGRFVMPKGGGWTDDLFLQDTRESVEAQLRYTKQMNLNSIRCEGFWGKDETLYDLCDEYGIMVMIGWNCHWEWQEYLLKPVDEKYGGPVSDEDIKLISEYWFDQMMWLRNHPSIYCWMVGSDKMPAPKLEINYAEMFKKYDPSRPVAASAGGVGTGQDGVVAKVALISELTGPTGMKMLGPYAFTPPVYWYTDTTRGGAYGFNTETGPGESVPPLASLERMFPKESLWPIDRKVWEFHTGRNEFTTLSRFLNGLNGRYGASKNIDDFAYKSQVSNYELMRPMFEAYVAHKPLSTGLVQWKQNSAWPELVWQLYDTYLQPGGTFYGTRKACTPLHAIYRYGFNDIYIANENLKDADSLTVKIRVFDINSKEVFSDQWKGGVQSNISKFIYKLPDIKNITPVYFLYLAIFDNKGMELDNNIYWLSVKKDILDYKAAAKLPWPYYTPTNQYADFTALNTLPRVKLAMEYGYDRDEVFGTIKIKMKNTSPSIAFCICFDPRDASTGKPILPVYWNDNYVTLFPGEERTYSARYFLRDSKGDRPVIKVNAWNVDTTELK